MTGIETVGVALIGALVAIFFFIVYSSLPKEKDWITEAENVHTNPSKPTTDTNVTTCGKKRCAYCETLNDHETGVCDRCGAPLGDG